MVDDGQARSDIVATNNDSALAENEGVALAVLKR
jgi:hypothetical protein